MAVVDAAVAEVRALSAERIGPTLAAICGLLALGLLLRVFATAGRQTRRRRGRRLALVALALLVLATPGSPLLPLTLGALGALVLTLMLNLLSGSAGRRRSPLRLPAVPGFGRIQLRPRWLGAAAWVMLAVGVAGGTPVMLAQLGALLPARAAMPSELDPAGAVEPGGVFVRAGDTALLPLEQAFPPLIGVRTAASSGLDGHTLAVKQDGTLWAVGRNTFGALGVTTPPPDERTWVQVPGMDGVVAVAATTFKSLAVLSDGTLWIWGSETESGALGVPTDSTCGVDFHLPCVRRPTQVSGVSGAKAGAFGSEMTAVLKQDGTVWWWGFTTVINPEPTDPCENHVIGLQQVAGLSNATAISGGGSVLHFLARTADGTAWAWGFNYFGQFGRDPGSIGFRCGVTEHSTGTFRAYSETALPVPILSGVKAIASGTEYNLAINGDGVVYAWGRNDFGQLGDGTFTNRFTPDVVRNPGGAGTFRAYAIGTRGATSFALTGSYYEDGSLWRWGVGERFNSPAPTPCGTGLCDLTPRRLLSPAVQVPVVAVSPASLSFPLQGVGGASPPQSVTVSNSGNGTAFLNITASPDFAVDSSDCGTNLGHSRTCALLVRFTPVAGGARSGTLTIADNGLGGPRTVVLGGPAYDPYDILHHCALSTTWTLHAGLGTCATFGTFLAQQTDLAIPGRGAGLTLTRTYHSADPADVGFGQGWSFNFGMSVTAEPGGTLLVRAADGRRDRYTPAGGTSYTAPPGIYDTLVRHGNGTYTLTTPDQFAHRFDDAGRLQGIADRNNNRTTLNYPGDRLVIEEPHTGRRLLLFYGTGADSRRFVRLEERQALGRDVHYAYDPATGDLTTVTDPRDNPIAMTYEGHRLKTVTNQEGEIVVTNAYDGQGRVATQQDGKSNTWTFDYGQANRTAVDGPRTDLADTTTYEYDAGFRLITITDPAAGGLAAGTTAITRDNNNEAQCVKDRFGGRTRRDFDRGNLVRLVDAKHTDASCNGAVATVWGYNARNDPDFVIDARGHRTDYKYDDNGNIKEVHRPLTNGRRPVTTYTHNPGNGDLLSVQDPDGFTTTYEHTDHWGYITRIHDPAYAGNVTTLTYDAGGRLLKREDQLGHTTDYGYNPVTAAKAKVTIKVYPGGGVTIEERTEYDKVGRAVELTDGNGHVTRVQYDPNGNRALVTVARGTTEHATTAYLYDEADNLKQLTDPDDRSTLYLYDALDRLTSSVAPAPAAGQAALTTTYTYDDAQRKVSKLDPANGTTVYIHDPLGRVTGIDYPATNGHAPVTAYHVGYDYDAVGNRKLMTDQQGTTDYTYDPLNRLIKVVSPQHPGAQPSTATVEYLHDQPNPDLGNARNCTLLQYPALKNDSRIRQVRYCADEVGRLKSVRDWNNHTTTYVYDPAGRLDTTTYHNGTLIRYGHDDADRLVSVANLRTDPAGTRTRLPAPDDGDEADGAPGPSRFPSGATPAIDSGGTAVPVGPPVNAFAVGIITSHLYTLDGVGNRGKAQEVTAVAGTSGENVYLYDHQDRLVSAKYAEDPPDGATTYDYTRGGDRKWLQRGTGHRRHYHYDEAGRLDGTGTLPFAADRNGNTTLRTINGGGQRGDTTERLSYDGANLLLAASQIWSNGSLVRHFRYNGDGLLVFEYRQDTDTRRRYYAYDVSRPNPVVLSDSERLYVHGLGLIAQIQPGKQTASGTQPDEYVHYHPDGTGSTRALTDGGGATVAAYDYDVFGLVRAQAGTNQEGGGRSYRFTGEPYESDTDTVYLRARHYDPTIGRFLQADPLGSTTGNLYAYAANNPVTLADHSGLEPENGTPAPVNLPPWLEQAGASGARRGPIGGIPGQRRLPGLDEFERTIGPLEARAREIHSRLDRIGRTRNTTAVVRAIGPDGETRVVVGFNGGPLRRSQKPLDAGEIAAPGVAGKHAEVNAIRHAQRLGYQPIEVAASRDICPRCAWEIYEAGAIPVSPLEQPFLPPWRP